MVDSNQAVSVITLNISDLNALIRRQKIVRVGQKARLNSVLCIRNPL